MFNFLPLEVDERARRRVVWWLLVTCFLVAAMVVVGGATRLTDSGLSITEWKPVTGIVPPLSDADWAAEFTKYQTIPEYELVNKGMDLDAFKSIYWWEWGHRFLGRIIGFVFFLPLVYFLATKQVARGLAPKLIVMFILGGAQGALGWFMVQSGLSDRVDVSQYRLAAHLGAAFLIYAYILWVALDLLLNREGTSLPAKLNNWTPLYMGSLFVIGLIYLQVILGGFVAGLHAGHAYNTWPLMDSGFVPNGYFFLSPWIRNFFENVATVQFNHRLAGYLIFVAVALLFKTVRTEKATAPVRTAFYVLSCVVVVQIALGVWTLLAVVPLALGLAHQAGALAAFTASLVFAQMVRRDASGTRAPPLPYSAP